MDADGTLEHVLRELAAVQDQLLETPDDDFATRHALRTAQDQLRAEAAALREDRPLTAEERSRLEQRLKLLWTRLESLHGQRIATRMMVTRSTGAGGATPHDVGGMMAIDRGILAAGGEAEIRREINVIQQRLARDAGDGDTDGPVFG